MRLPKCPKCRSSSIVAIRDAKHHRCSDCHHMFVVICLSEEELVSWLRRLSPGGKTGIENAVDIDSVAREIIGLVGDKR